MNTVGYFEIQVDNPDKARIFYSEIFNWKFTKEPNLPIEYWRIEGAGPFGGLLKRPNKIPPSGCGTNAFVCSIEVSDFDEVEKKIVDRGGHITLPKFAIPGKCWQGYFVDPFGNTFGLFQVDVHAK